MSDQLSEALKAVEAQLAPRFNPGVLQQQLQQGEVVFQFLFDAEPPFYLEVRQKAFAFHVGEAEAATLSLHIDNHHTCQSLLQGRADGMQAFMEGRYRADGNIVLSQLLLYLFRADDMGIAYLVQD